MRTNFSASFFFYFIFAQFFYALTFFFNARKEGKARKSAVKIRFNFCRYAISITGEVPMPGTISGKIYRDKKPKTLLLARTKRISKDMKKGRKRERERGGDRLCVCWRHATHLSKSSWAAARRRGKGQGARGSCSAAQRAATALVVLLISLATKGSRATCRATHTNTHTLAQGVAGSIEPNRAQSRAHLLLASSLNVQSAPAAGWELPPPLAAAFVATATCATF